MEEVRRQVAYLSGAVVFISAVTLHDYFSSFGLVRYIDTVSLTNFLIRGVGEVFRHPQSIVALLASWLILLAVDRDVTFVGAGFRIGARTIGALWHVPIVFLLLWAGTSIGDEAHQRDVRERTSRLPKLTDLSISACPGASLRSDGSYERLMSEETDNGRNCAAAVHVRQGTTLSRCVVSGPDAPRCRLVLETSDAYFLVRLTGSRRPPLMILPKRGVEYAELSPVACAWDRSSGRREFRCG